MDLKLAVCKRSYPPMSTSVKFRSFQDIGKWVVVCEEDLERDTIQVIMEFLSNRPFKS
ncbi:hypothetical protein DPMN_165584 [Dreissena polymorpha]|uniref:Uncharacterized protein n=1 Tax=Dreissena polymorpha TaxID=45954 RepID=A0A9D4IUQ9_DREPO|nr:hypothetical protein DPMN_165584 [Dreissena polymorpha]